MLDLKLIKRVDINEQGTALIINRVEIRNKSDQPELLTLFGIREDTSDVVDIFVKDSEGKKLPYQKSVKEGFVSLEFDLKGKTLDVDKTYFLTLQYTIPNMVKRFDRTYFCEELFVHAYPAAETCEWSVTYNLPELFDRYEFWKEMYINAPQASKIHTNERVSYEFVLPKGSHREISFTFQERYNSKIISLLSFLLGVVMIQFFEWLLGLMF